MEIVSHEQFAPKNVRQFMRMLDHLTAEDIAAIVEVSIETLDKRDGDPDIEDDDPAEEAGDHLDTSYSEWHTRGRHKTDGTFGTEMPPPNSICFGYHEDSEDDDEDQCEAGDDRPYSGNAPGYSAHDGYNGAGDDADAEGCTWPERLEQRWCMAAGLDGDSRDNDDAEPRWVPPAWVLPAANEH